MNFLRRERPAPLTTGTLFRRISEGRVIDTARVIGLCTDPVGIPHVRFSLHHERTAAADELRTLSVAAFQALFSEQVRL